VPLREPEDERPEPHALDDAGNLKTAPLEVGHACIFTLSRPRVCNPVFS
jgi:hypothetical protein